MRPLRLSPATLRHDCGGRSVDEQRSRALRARRAYRAACPNCGAPVEFRSAASPFAVCSFCRSTRRPRRRRAAQDRRERRAVRRPHAAAARRRRQVPGRGVHAGRPAAVPLRRRHLERVARPLRQRPDGRSRAGSARTTAATSSPSTRRWRRRAAAGEAAPRRAAQVNGQAGRSPRSSPRKLSPPRASCRSGRTSSTASSSPTCAASAARSARSTTAIRRGRAGRSAARSRSPSWR